MDIVNYLVRGLWDLSIGIQAFLIVRLTTERLVRSYPLFYSYLVLDIITSLVMVNISIESMLYTIIWTATRPFLFTLQCFTVYELHKKICDHYPGVAEYRRRLALATAVAAAVTCLIAAWPQIAHFTKPVVSYGPLLVMRIVYSSLLVFLILLWAIVRFVDTIPVGKKHNVALHLRLLTWYFGINSLFAILILSLPPALTLGLNIAMLGTTCTCLAIWLAGMTRAGEVMPPPVLLPYDPVQIEASIKELRYKLRTLNPTV
ncbi:MAG TPA: hypothetical protein VKU01_35045 [Bryobacteraceae bacterium]|nr:hypothetical protein [Bryobacteraceae bacterium]